MYERNSANEEFIEWIEKLESVCQDKIDEKKQLWFQTEFTRDDIETMMTPIARMYKSGKYLLIRAYINENKYTGKDKCIVYNENEINVEIDSITEESFIIPLILIDGIKFTSRSFEIDIKIVQIMVLDKPAPEISACLIKKTENGNSISNASISASNSISNTEPITINKIVEKEEEDLENTAPIIAPPIMHATQPIIIATPIIAPPILEKPSIEEIQINYETISDTIILKKPNEVYYEQYRIAKQKAIELRENALNAMLAAKNIKLTHQLVDEDSEDDDLDEDF